MSAAVRPVVFLIATAFVFAPLERAAAQEMLAPRDTFAADAMHHLGGLIWTIYDGLGTFMEPFAPIATVLSAIFTLCAARSALVAARASKEMVSLTRQQSLPVITMAPPSSPILTADLLGNDPLFLNFTLENRGKSTGIVRAIVRSWKVEKIIVKDGRDHTLPNPINDESLEIKDWKEYVRIVASEGRGEEVVVDVHNLRNQLRPLISKLIEEEDAVVPGNVDQIERFLHDYRIYLMGWIEFTDVSGLEFRTGYAYFADKLSGWHLRNVAPETSPSDYIYFRQYNVSENSEAGKQRKERAESRRERRSSGAQDRIP